MNEPTWLAGFFQLRVSLLCFILFHVKPLAWGSEIDQDQNMDTVTHGLKSVRLQPLGSATKGPPFSRSRSFAEAEPPRHRRAAAPSKTFKCQWVKTEPSGTMQSGKFGKRGEERRCGGWSSGLKWGIAARNDGLAPGEPTCT